MVFGDFKRFGKNTSMPLWREEYEFWRIHYGSLVGGVSSTTDFFKKFK